MTSTTIRLPLRKELAEGIQVEVDVMHPHEQEAVRSLLNRVVLDEQTYPQNRPLSETEFKDYWMSSDAFVARADGEVLGAFYLKPNFPGRCSHICNAGFIVQPAMRRKGLGLWMGQLMLDIARVKGYSAVMFNLVFETNKPSIYLWRSLGFTTIGRVPQAARLSNGQTVDAFMLYRSLTDV